MRLISLLLLFLFLTACSATPTDPSTGTITLIYPPENATIYSDLLTVSGTLSDVPMQSIRFEIIDADGTIRAHAMATVTTGAWTIEIPLPAVVQPESYRLAIVVGDTPYHVNVTDRTADTAIFVTRPFTRAPLSERIDEITVTIDLEAGATIGGDTIPVNGRASGITTFTVELVDSTQTILASQRITRPNPLDEAPWLAELAPGAYTGSALIRVIHDGIAIWAVPIILTPTAG